MEFGAVPLTYLLKLGMFLFCNQVLFLQMLVIISKIFKGYLGKNIGGANLASWRDGASIDPIVATAL